MGSEAMKADSNGNRKVDKGTCSRLGRGVQATNGLVPLSRVLPWLAYGPCGPDGTTPRSYSRPCLSIKYCATAWRARWLSAPEKWMYSEREPGQGVLLVEALAPTCTML